MAKYESKSEDGKCIFCEIISGNIPKADFWENEKFIAFLAIDPNTEGFSCVVPKEHFGSDVLKMPDENLKEFILAAKEAAKVLENFYHDVGRVGLIMEGNGIDHAHIKLIPMHGTEYLKDGIWKQFPSGKEVYFTKYEGFISSAGGPRASFEDLKILANQIKMVVNNS